MTLKKTSRRQFAITVLLLLLSSSFISDLSAQQTTIYIVRHAEKNLADPNTKNPALSLDGLQRSYDLEKLLAGEGIAAIFSTDYIRTRKTGEPLAKRIGKDLFLYNAAEQKTLVNKVKKDFAGKTVLIVGHSNTVLSLVDAFGGKTSITEIKDSEYRNLFKLVIKGTEVTTTELTYGR